MCRQERPPYRSGVTCWAAAEDANVRHKKRPMTMAEDTGKRLGSLWIIAGLASEKGAGGPKLQKDLEVASIPPPGSVSRERAAGRCQASLAHIDALKPSTPCGSVKRSSALIIRKSLIRWSPSPSCSARRAKTAEPLVPAC